MQKRQSVSQKFTYWLKVVSLGMILGLGLQFAQAWTAPTVAPPGGNVAGPLTTGAANQTKIGALSASNFLYTGYNQDMNSGGRLYGISSGGNFGGREFVMTVNGGAGEANDEIWIGPNINSYTGHTQINGGHIRFRTNNGDGLIDMTSSGNVGIGTVTPAQRLDVNGNVKANQFCIGTNCISSWPSGGGSGDNLGNHTATQNLAMGGFNISNAADVYANRFFDNNNTSYYLDPASTSYLNTLGVVGNYTTTNGNITTTNGDISGKRVCINGVCQGSWPAGGAGTVTNVATGSGLTGGPITGTGTVGINTTDIAACTGANQKVLWSAASSRFVCGTDAGGSAYTAGTGLTLSGTTFSINNTQTQTRVSGTCSPGTAVTAIAANGTVTCGQVGNSATTCTINGVSTPAGNYCYTHTNCGPNFAQWKCDNTSALYPNPSGLARWVYASGCSIPSAFTTPLCSW